MDKSELRELGVLPLEKVRNALNSGEQAKALALCDKLPKEFVLMHVGLRKMVTVLLDYIEPFFRTEQAAIAERIRSAIQAKDKAAALALIEEKRELQYRPVHDLLLEFKAGSYDYVLRQYGVQPLYDCQRHVAEGQRAGFEKQVNGVLEDTIRAVAYTFSLHLGKTTITEDEQRYTATLDPCGSGGCMVRDHKVEPEGHHARVPGALPMTFNREGWPAYCAHCAVWDEIAGIEWFGHPMRAFEPWQSPEDPCRWHLYKDPNDIPAEHWTMFGFQKPANLPKPKRGPAISKEELASLGLLPSDKVRAALEAGNFDLALTLCDQLPKEYVLMVKGLGLVVRVLLDYHEKLFRREQVAIVERIKAAITGGHTAEAISLINEKKSQHIGVHDLCIDFMAATFGWFYSGFGEDSLHKCLYYVGEQHRAGFETWAKLPAEEYVKVCANLFAQHSEGNVTVEEDGEKFSIVCNPCGTGGKLELDGVYDPPISKYPRIKNPSPLTFGQPDFPIYCTHCPSWNAIVPIDLLGRPLFVNVPMQTPGGPCLALIYKDPRNIPAEFYRAVGREKPVG